MFMNDRPSKRYGADSAGETSTVSAASPEPRATSDYQRLLNTVDAARAGLAWGEHDYDEMDEVGA